MLITAPLPATGGPIGGLVANLPATIENSGWEFTINTINLKRRDFTWSTNINITVPKNRLTYFENLDNSVYSSIYVIGSPSNLVKLYHSIGVNPTSGMYEFLDKDGKVTSDPSSDPLNYNKIIDPNPAYYGGLNNSFSYKGISLDFMFQYVKQKGNNQLYSAPPGASKSNQVFSVLNRWKKEGDIKPIQRYSASNPDYSSAFYNQNFSDAYWGDASYLRIKNVAVSYILPQRWISKAGIQTCRIYLSSQNLFTITSYKGLDPETLSNISLPPLRVLVAGIQVSL
jgi:hypothetical protein